MSRALTIALALASASCTSDFAFIFDLNGDRLALVIDGEMVVCDLANRDLVGAPAYPAAPDCEAHEGFVFGAQRRWSLAEDGILIVAKDEQVSRPECRAGCYFVLRYDLDARRESLLLPRAERAYGVQSSGPWLVWLDLRHDQNGQCNFPEGDDDCVVELYAYDRRDQRTLRLTERGTVYPPVDFLTDSVFTVRGTSVVYVDRAAADPACFELTGPAPGVTACATALREVDLASGVDRPLLARPHLMLRPRVGQTGVAWVESREWPDAALMLADPAGSGDPQTITTEISPVGLDATDDWLVWLTGQAIRAYDTASGREVLVVDGELSSPNVDRGRVAWRSPDTTIRSYDLATGERRVLMEVQ